MSIMDPINNNYFEHFGVKGMRWGIRKAAYNSSQRALSSESKLSGQMQTAIAAEKKGGAATQSKEHKKALQEAAWNLEGFDDTTARELSRAAAGKPANKKAVLQGLTSVKATADSNVSTMKKEVSKNKKRLDTLASEMQKERDAKAEAKRVTNGKEFVNFLFSGNKYGNITKGVVAQYVLAAGAITYIALK